MTVINTVIFILKTEFWFFLTGFTGTLQRAIGETQSAWGSGTGQEDTIRLEEYYVQKDIRILDTRSFFQWDERALEESCLEGKLPQSRHFVREGGLTESRPETSISNGTLQKFLN